MNAGSEPLVSVLTPVYNGGPYLRQCIESVLAQTYSNWEYIIVNNCSTDDTRQIAEEYAAKDARVRVVNNPELIDIISNHNLAFSLISPESRYTKIVSGDDWLFPDCLTRMVAVADANLSVGLVGAYQLSGSGSEWRNWRVRWTELPYPSTVLAGREVCRMQMLSGVYVFGTPTSLLYRSDLVRANARFYPNSTPEADTSCCYRCLQTTDFGFVHQVLSYERVHEQTVSAQSRSINAYMASRLSDLTKYGPNYLTAAELRERVEALLDDYYRYLATSAFHMRNREFWTYHRSRLQGCGHRFSSLRFAKAVSAKAITLALNPLQTTQAIFRRLGWPPAA